MGIDGWRDRGKDGETLSSFLCAYGWTCIVIYCHVGPYMVIYCQVWLYMVMYGHAQSFMVMYDHVWGVHKKGAAVFASFFQLKHAKRVRHISFERQDH